MYKFVFYKVFVHIKQKSAQHKEVKMSIKKLTMAAAIAVGIATCSLNTVMAACPCNQNEAMPVVTDSSDCAKPQCNKCKRKKADKCKKHKGCPVKSAPENDDISCNKTAGPSVALCPQSGKPDRAQMKQVYGYPQAVYGTNNYVGESANSIFSTETAMTGCPASRLIGNNIGGVTISSQTESQITGAAASMPCLNELPQSNNSVNVDRNKSDACPIDFKTSNSINAVKKSLVPYTIKENITGAAAPAYHNGGCMFPDVPNGYWAACGID